MNHHPTPHDTASPEGAPNDAFDRLARSAGAELRRPAPADGMRRVRSARRRQQATRNVAAGTAAVLVIGLGAFAVSRGTGDDGDLATSPDPTTVPTTLPDPTPTTLPETAGTTIPPVPTTVPGSDEVDRWLATQRAAGRTNVYRLTGVGTDASGLLAQTADTEDAAAVIILPDGRTIDVPEPVVDGIWSTLRVYGIGDSVAVIEQAFGGAPGAPVPLTLHVLDPATGVWSDGPPLGLDREPGAGLHVLSVDGSLLVGRSVWDETGENAAVPSPDRAGVIVRPDLTVEPVATPPDGVQMEWTSAFGPWALNFGLEPGALDYTPYDQPWRLDVERNEWSPIALPDWLDCEPAADCQWFTPHEFGDRFLEVVTERGVLKRIPDGTVAIYDPATDTWTRMDDPPFALAMPATALLDDRVVVAPANAPYSDEEQDDFGQIGVLDLATGTWTSVERFEVTDDQSRWEIRVDAAGAIAQPVTIDPVDALDLSGGHALDLGATTWRRATTADTERWAAAAPQFDLAG